MSIVVLCCIEKVCSWAKHVFMKTVLSIIGSIRIRILVSSTCVTVHKLHAPGELVGIAARSKNLEKLIDFDIIS